jgi:flagellar motility protein MotE (MotC chaperone)
MKYVLVFTMIFTTVAATAATEGKSGEQGAESREKIPSKDPQAMSVPERLDLLKTLETKLNELKLKELQIQKFKDELDLQRNMVEDRIRYMEDLKKGLADRLDQKMQEDMEAVKQMTKVYEAMSAKSAAQIFETLDLDMARVVIHEMNKKKAAEILNKVSKDRAVQISEFYAGFNPGKKERTMDSIQRNQKQQEQAKAP